MASRMDTVGPSADVVSRLRRSTAADVLDDPASLALYSADASNYRHVPTAVVLPRGEDDVAATLAVCRDHAVPLTMRGAGTSIAGNCLGAGIVMDTSRYFDAIEDIDTAAATAVVRPGVVGGHLREALAPSGLAFAPDPSTISRCTVGGMIGNNSCGSHSVAWGKTSENIRALEVMLADGTRLELGPTTAEQMAAAAARGGAAGRLYRGLDALTTENLALLRTELGRFPRQVSGYGLHELLPDNRRNLARALVGSEGTCAVVLRATLDLVRPPAHRALLVLGFDGDIASARAVPAILEHSPLTVESMGRKLFAGVRLHGARATAADALPDTSDWLLVETGGATPEDARAAAETLASGIGMPVGSDRRAVVLTDPARQKVVWSLRADGSGLAARTIDGDAAYPGFEDAAVPPERLADYLTDFRGLLGEYGLSGVSYGHYGEGCLHIRLDADLSTAPGVDRYRAFLFDAADVVARYGGSISGEHGDGQARSELLPRAYSPEVIGLFERFKGLWDPDGLLNPGILVRPKKVDDDVRWLELGVREWDTEYSYPDDRGSFRQAVSRCLGIGKCRVEHGVAMCPSYQVTRDEKHSTRGRARMLFEMLQGDVIDDGWRSKEVLGALDLCLSCKACKSDCPVNVDMATYKSEFLYQHYRGRLRPRVHYALGRLPQWARLASWAPRVVNALSGGRLTGAAAKRAAGIDARRDLPRFAPRTLRRQWRDRPPARAAARGTVVLWPDTFTNHLDPGVGMAAAAVLEDAGYRVELPGGPVCCGLTALSTGQLPLARKTVRKSLDVLAPHLAAGAPVIGLEPSCTAALRSEITRLLPDDDRARALSGLVRTFAEQLVDHTPGWEPPAEPQDAVVQTHCHQYAELGDDADRALMRRAGIRPTEMSPGCCGLAGNFGFEDGHYEVSMAVAEQNLLPAIRSAGADPLVIADGFSCRTQARDGADVRARHLAEVLAERLTGGGSAAG
ncbi:FAD-binding and (Fe-S)-binding domain-containing protein [Tomitella gaofuii]|uniref:FAD-binding and (Fe-S)-binding domain-containing protein n=1 Tax=Tomitella gaofuii TaxID=2760083 RepID=UPI001C716A77|nr:FAD-binding and (Fe-S)-binding domain-containing protein [Tomitella gaofuii]